MHETSSLTPRNCQRYTSVFLKLNKICKVTHMYFYMRKIIIITTNNDNVKYWSMTLGPPCVYVYTLMYIVSCVHESHIYFLCWFFVPFFLSCLSVRSCVYIIAQLSRYISENNIMNIKGTPTHTQKYTEHVHKCFSFTCWFLAYFPFHLYTYTEGCYLFTFRELPEI